MTLMMSVVVMICMLVSVAFFTVLERKILSYIQLRKGPNKVGILGLLQPFADAIKLFNKNIYSNESSNSLVFYWCPPLSFLLSLLLMPLIPFLPYPLFDNKHNFLLFMVISSMSVYSMLLIGWSCNSKYGHLGSIRSIAQMISYEISFFLIILYFCLLTNSYNFSSFVFSQKFLFFFWGNLVIFIMWFSSCLAEVNRSPFDFAEGESELVSGFNVEFMGGPFALIFLAEYSNMLILSLITSTLFFKSIKTSFLIFLMITTTLLWIRGSFPRFRYDFLMHFNWMIILPMILFVVPIPILLALTIY